MVLEGSADWEMYLVKYFLIIECFDMYLGIRAPFVLEGWRVVGPLSDTFISLHGNVSGLYLQALCE